MVRFTNLFGGLARRSLIEPEVHKRQSIFWEFAG